MEIGLTKLMLFPEKLNNILNINEQNTIDKTYPISVELSLTNKCNQHCVWCSDYELRNRLPGTLDKKTIFKLIDDLKKGGTKGIVIEGGGEPTLHSDFCDIVEYITDKGLAVGLITNGVLLNYEHLLEKFEWIRVSLDASDKSEYLRLKKTNYFDRVMNNIKIIASKTKVCGVGYILTQYNLDNLDELSVRLKKMGVKYIHFRPVIDNPDLYIEKDLSYLKKYENKDFSILDSALNENKIRGNSELPCIAHSITSVISANGDVFICGRLNIYNWLEPLGNIKENSFNEIWNGEKRIGQAKKVLDSNFCNRYCPECRITKFNIFLNDLKNIKTKNFI
jgi:radical SAM protein with 4Fe4S-binding SPASM domain